MQFQAMFKVAVMAVGLLAGHAAAQDLRSGDAAAPAATRHAPDPLAEVYLVSSRETYRQAIQQVAHQASSHRDGAGRNLVISQVRQYQLPIVSGAIHQRENRCGGFFAFDSRAQAEDFIRSDRTAQAMLAAPVAYTIDNQATVDPWLPQVDDGAIKATIDELSAYRNRYYASPHGQAAAESIRDRWQALADGRSDVTTTLFTACPGCSTQPSVILTIAGSDLADEIVVLGAHLDSINGGGGGGDEQVAPGADDDASGIATLTEVLRVALAGDWRPRRTVMFMGYAAEEVGLRGSNAIANAFRNSGQDVVGVLQLDMTNYRLGTGVDMQVITDYSNAAMKQFLGDLFDAYLAPLGLTRGRYTCGYGCSDHASWTSAGYPSAMMFEAGDENGNYFPYIHSSSDTMANMGDSAANSAKFARFGLAFLGELGKTASDDGDTDGGALANGVAVDGIGKTSGSITFHLDVPARSTRLVFTISGGSGNADLYMKRGSVPTDVSFDCRPLKPGNAEACGLVVPRAGTYYVKLKANPSFEGVSLKASYRAR
jgi:leucyl aminopeptidase